MTIKHFMIDPNRIDLSKVMQDLRPFEGQWVAISEKSHIVANGTTYGETVSKVSRADEVILLKVPPLGYSLAPLEG